MRHHKSSAHPSITDLPNSDWFKHRTNSGDDGLDCYQYNGLTFCIVDVHRERLARLGEYIKPKKLGVYAIFNPLRQEIYVGQGDLRSRLNEHDHGKMAKKFWTKGVALFSLDDKNFTSDMAKNLEHWLIGSIKSSWTVFNKNAGHSVSLGDSSIGAMLIAKGMLRHHLVSPDGWFDQGSAHQTDRTKERDAEVGPGARRDPRHRSSSLPTNVRRIITEQDILDRGWAFDTNKSYGRVMGSVLEEGGSTGVLVRAGSSFSKVKGSLGLYDRKRRDELIEKQKIDPVALKVLDNCVFSSFSGAASFLNGCSTNGPLFFSSMNDAASEAKAASCGG